MINYEDLDVGLKSIFSVRPISIVESAPSRLQETKFSRTKSRSPKILSVLFRSDRQRLRGGWVGKPFR